MGNEQTKKFISGKVWNDIYEDPLYDMTEIQEYVYKHEDNNPKLYDMLFGNFTFSLL
jgi:hypothetical protein